MFTQDQVDTIRTLLEQEEKTVDEVAKHFGLSRPTFERRLMLSGWRLTFSRSITRIPAANLTREEAVA